MGASRPFEEQLEIDASRYLDRLSRKHGADARIEILEAVASSIGGWSLSEYRRAFSEAHALETALAKKYAIDLRQLLGKVPIHPALVLSRLSQPSMKESRQRQTGSYYTDFRLANFLAQTTTKALDKNSRVVDTACGTGVLLVAFVLQSSTGNHRTLNHTISSCIYGIDMSSKALRGARLALASLTSDLNTVRSLDKHLIIQDSLSVGGGFWKSIAPDGFDVVIGNPPWERLKLDRHEFAKDEGSKSSYGANLRLSNKSREKLNRQRNSIATHRDSLDQQFPLASIGELDLYKAFLELSTQIVKPSGQISLLLPGGLIRSASTKTLRELLFERGKRVSIALLDNRSRFFGIDSRFKFLALNVSFAAERSRRIELSHPHVSPELIVNRGKTQVSLRQLKSWSDSLLIPEVRSTKELRLFGRLYSAGTRLADSDEWRPNLLREVDMTNDRHLFLRSPTADSLPVVEGRMVHQHRIGGKSYRKGTGRSALWVNNPPGKSVIEPQYWIEQDKLTEEVLHRSRTSRIGFCDITGQTNERTVLVCRVPSGVVCGNKVPTAVLPKSQSELAWIAIANSFVFDWLARRVVTTTLNYFVLLTLPFPQITSDSADGLQLSELASRLDNLDRGGIISYGILQQIRAEIDARVSLLYGLDLADTKLILEDFRLIDRHQRPLTGEERSTITRDLILENYCRLAGLDSTPYLERVEAARQFGATGFLPAQFCASSPRDRSLLL